MKIFIVEDEPEIRLELKALLENALYQTQTTESFESLVDQILEAEPDLVLLDWNLPGENGDWVLSKVRARSSDDVPVLFWLLFSGFIPVQKKIPENEYPGLDG